MEKSQPLLLCLMHMEMTGDDLKAILDAFLASQRESNEVLLKALGIYSMAGGDAIAPVNSPTPDEVEVPKFWPDVEFDPAMEDPAFWPDPSVLRLGDEPRRTETVGEITDARP